MWMWQETILQNFVKFGENLKKIAPWLPWQRPPFWILSTPKAATHYGGYSCKVSWSLMKGIQNYFKSPLFLFPWQLQQSLSNRFRFFWAYLVPLDVDIVPIKFHQFLFGKEPAMIIFVLFNFLAFWPFPWQSFWKNQPLTAQLHMAYDIPTRFHKLWSRHLREIEWTKMCGRIIIIIE
jgi:hypothetical protein